MVTEPTLEEAKAIRKELYAAESTELNAKKIRAIEAQINRLELQSRLEAKDA